MSQDHTISITIEDVNIPTKWRRKLQTLQKFEKETFWKAGTINEEEVIYYENQVLDQDLRVSYSENFLMIWTGHDIDRDNLAYLDRLIGSKADIDVSQKGNIELRYRMYDTSSEYTKFPTYKTKDDIKTPLFDKDVRIRN